MKFLNKFKGWFEVKKDQPTSKEIMECLLKGGKVKHSKSKEFWKLGKNDEIVDQDGNEHHLLDDAILFEPVIAFSKTQLFTFIQECQQSRFPTEICIDKLFKEKKNEFRERN